MYKAIVADFLSVLLLLGGDMDIQWWDHGAWHGEGTPMSMVR